MIKKRKKETANKTSSILVVDPFQIRKTPLSMAVGFALLVMAAPQVSAAGNYYVLGRDVSTIWNWQHTDYLDKWEVTVEGQSADDDDYRSILVLEGSAADEGTSIFINPRSVAVDRFTRAKFSSVNFKQYANTPQKIKANDKVWYSRYEEAGPSIYQVHVVGVGNSSEKYSRDASNVQVDLSNSSFRGDPSTLQLEVADWESGYIYLENEGLLAGSTGWGYVPGVITVTSGGSLSEKDLAGFGDGGDVVINIDVSNNPSVKPRIDINGRVGYFQDSAVPNVMSTSLPWRTAGAAVSATSSGGQGSSVDFPFVGEAYVSAGNGGDVSVRLIGQEKDQTNPFAWKPLEIHIGSNGILLDLDPPGLSGSQTAPFVGVSAVSQGGKFLPRHLLFGDSRNDFFSMLDNTGAGNGGNVDVYVSATKILSTALRGETPYVIGVVAASVGGSAQSYPTDTKYSNLGVSPGIGGDVTVQLGGESKILLPSNNSIGVVATSTGDQTILAAGEQRIAVGYKDKSHIGSVYIGIDNEVTILVGDKALDAAQVKPGDTNIGVLANASSNWARELFTGKTLSHLIPGYAGDVTVRNDGSVTAYGANAVGILAQSLSGLSVSTPGSLRIGNPEKLQVSVADISPAGVLPAAPGGKVTYSSTGGFVSVKGDGATGVLVQSIGGGGGAGGDATGLFVAVGGNGKDGGHGGTLVVSMENSSITASGDHARGMIGQTIGGGGGHGGHAKAFGLFAGEGVGGAGGGGGDGGNATFTAKNVLVTTTGQHAYGLAFQSIGGGGGTGGAEQTKDVGVGFTVAMGVGGSGGAAGRGGELNVTLDKSSNIVTTGVDSHGVLLQSISGGGGTAGAASGATYNIGDIPDFPFKVNFDVQMGGKGGSSKTPGKITVTNEGTISTSGANSYGLSLQSIGGGGGHGADSTAGTNSWGDSGENPLVSFDSSMALGGSGGAAGNGGAIDLTSTGTIEAWGHHSVAVLAQSVGGGGGSAGKGNAYDTKRWVGDNKGEGAPSTLSISTTLGAGGNGKAGGDGGPVNVTISPSTGTGLTTVGSGAIGVIAQSVGGGGGVAGDAGTQAINGGKVTVGMQLGGSGGKGGHGGVVDLDFSGSIQTGAVTQLQYADDDGKTQLSSPVTIGGNSHGIVAQSIGGGGGVGGNADPSTALVPELNKLIASWKKEPKKLQKIMNVKDGIEFWAKRNSKTKDDKDRPTFDMSYSGNLTLGGAGGSGGHGGDVEVTLGKSDITTFGHHSYGVMAQSVGGGGGAGGTASANSVISEDVSASKLGKSISFKTNVTLGGSGGNSGNGGDIRLLVTNPRDTSYEPPNIQADGINYAKGNYIRTGGYASHALFAQSVGGGGGVGHEGSIIGLKSIQGYETNATLGNVTQGAVQAGDGGTVQVGHSDKYIVGWIYTAGDASSALFAQSIGGGGGTISFGCTTSGGKTNTVIRQSPCFTQATATWEDGGKASTFSAGQFVNDEQKYDLTLDGNGGLGGEVHVYLGDSHVVTDGDRSIAIMAQSIGGGGGYISADVRNIGSISQSAPVSGQKSSAGEVNVVIAGGKGGKGSAYIGTYGDGAWGVLAQSIGGGGGLFGDTSLHLAPFEQIPSFSFPSRDALASSVEVIMQGQAIIHTFGTNSHGIVAQSWSNGGGIFPVLQGDSPFETVLLGSTRTDMKYPGEGSSDVGVKVGADSEIDTKGNGSIGILTQTNGGQINVEVSGSVTGGRSYVNMAADGRRVAGIGVLINGGTDGGNQIHVKEGGSVSTQGETASGFAVVADSVTVNNAGTMTGSKDLGVNSELNNLPTGVLNTGALYKVGNNSLHNHGTINIGDEGSVGTTNFEGRIVQYDGGRMVVTFDALADQTHDRLIVDGTAVLGGSFEKRAKSLLPGDYEFLTATDLTVTAAAVDRLLYDWDVTVTDTGVTATPNSAFRTEGLSLSPTSQNLVSYLERAWDNANAHHAELFGYKHELEAVEDYNALLETLGGQALNAQPLQMRMSVLSNLGDSMACPVVTPNGLSLGEDRCVWAKLTGEVSDLSSSQDNLGYRSTGGGLRVGTQQTLGQGWTVGAAAGYALNDLTATDFSSNGQVFDLSLSAKRDVGQWSFGGSLGFAHGWFDNNRRVRAADAGIASGFNRQYNSKSRLSIYSAKLRAAYTFEQEAHYIRPYLDVDVAYSQAPGFSESGEGNLALQAQSNSQWNVGISPMVEYGADFVREDKTRMMFYVSAGATFLPNNQQTTAMSFVGAQAANGTFDIITDGPNVLGRLNIGMQVYEQEGYEVRAQYGLQAGKDYWSQNVSINAVFRF